MKLHFHDPKIVGFLSGLSTARASVKTRATHALLYKIDGESIYHMRGKDLDITPGTLLYIPENETYTFEKISNGDSHYHLVNFHSDTILPPMTVTMSSGDHIHQLFRQMERSFRFGGDAGQYECLSYFYHLLALVIQQEELPYATQQQKKQIDNAIRFLEEHLFDKALRMSDLPSMCGMSAPTFRHIFYSRFGTTPKRYLLQQRMLSAKLLLESGEYSDITQLADSVGFDDPLYFSKCFKSFYGISPSKYQK